MSPRTRTHLLRRLEASQHEGETQQEQQREDEVFDQRADGVCGNGPGGDPHDVDELPQRENADGRPKGPPRRQPAADAGEPEGQPDREQLNDDLEEQEDEHAHEMTPLGKPGRCGAAGEQHAARRDCPKLRPTRAAE
jgi:hypothetical protein